MPRSHRANGAASSRSKKSQQPAAKQVASAEDTAVAQRETPPKRGLNDDKYGRPITPGCIVATEDRRIDATTLLVTDVRNGTCMGYVISKTTDDEGPNDLTGWNTDAGFCGECVVLHRQLLELVDLLGEAKCTPAKDPRKDAWRQHRRQEAESKLTEEGRKRGDRVIIGDVDPRPVIVDLMQRVNKIYDEFDFLTGASTDMTVTSEIDINDVSATKAKEHLKNAETELRNVLTEAIALTTVDETDMHRWFETRGGKGGAA
jgi:hypothetical protein